MNNQIIATPAGYYATGWEDRPHEVAAVRTAWEARGMPADFDRAAPHLMTAAGDDDKPVFFWRAEEKVLGKRLATWNQGGVGSCVGFGGTRGAQDLMFLEIASGEPEEFPGTELSPEVSYAGSRVEVGGGGISGDGSVGAWLYEFLVKWGVVRRGKYGSIDLTAYSESLCRQLGRSGLPTELEQLAREHPVQAAAFVKSKEEGWAAMDALKPVVVCSNVGFTMTRDSDGFCNPSGQWNHCLGTRGKFKHPRRGRSVVIGNSWADYLGSKYNVIEYVDIDGSIKTETLPPGHFATTWDVWGRMLAQGDSAALAGLTGWKRQRMDWTP